MDEQRLYRIIDFILNQAEPRELDVIRAALRRREEDQVGPEMGAGPQSLSGNIGKMAQDMAAQVRDQIGASKDQIRDTVRQFVRELIKKEAPGLDEGQIQGLMDEWVPTGGIAANANPQRDAKSQSLQPEVLLTMIQQFVSFSTGALTVSEEASLKEAIPDWQRKYWEQFSGTTRKMTTLFLKGVIGESEYWDGVYDELGLTDPPSPS